MLIQRLENAWQRYQSWVCVGLDPDPAKMPAALAGADQPYFEFCRTIIDATAPYVAAFKPQFAHFAAAGREVELARVIHYARERWPDHVVILDAKRGDIGSTAAFYAKEAYERYRAHAVTINPYLGEESVRPFLDYEDGGVVVLCRTSNPDSDWLQAHGLPPVHLRVAERVMQWNTSGQCMLVTGATYPEELAEIRAAAPTVPTPGHLTATYRARQPPARYAPAVFFRYRPVQHRAPKTRCKL